MATVSPRSQLSREEVESVIGLSSRLPHEYGLMMDYVGRRCDLAAKELEDPLLSIDRVRVLQGTISALRMVLSLAETANKSIAK